MPATWQEPRSRRITIIPVRATLPRWAGRAVRLCPRGAGDRTCTLGLIRGFRRSHPELGPLYVDGDADVTTPDSAGSGILDAMGVAHLLGHGAPELSRS